MGEVRCLCCNGKGDVYYIASRPEIIGGKRARCDDCDGTGSVTGAVAEMQAILRGLGVAGRSTQPDRPAVLTSEGHLIPVTQTSVLYSDRGP